MSPSAISLTSASGQTQGQSLMKEIMEDFKQLDSSLKSGDLSGAQNAYSALQQLLPNQSQSGNPVSTDFAALGKALQSGDLSAAQSTFSQLQNDLQAAGTSSSANNLTQALKGHHRHHHASGSQSTSASASSSTTESTGTTGQTVNVLG